MKCLSLRQPYAELVVAGRKTIETRTWKTNFRGKFLIHASKAIDKENCDMLNIDCGPLTRGMVVGLAFLCDVKRYATKQDFVADKDRHFSSSFSEPKYGFLLKDAKKLSKPILVAGHLGFFEVNQWTMK